MDYRFSITLDELPSRLVNGMVFIRVFPEMYEKVGSFILGDLESIHTEKRRYNPVDHAVRFGEVAVISVKETADVKPGDLVWFDYLSGINAKLFDVKGKYYYLLEYSSLIVRKRGDEVMPLNGMVLCEPIFKTERLGAYEVELVDPNNAIIRYMQGSDENAELKPGDKIFTKSPVMFLEDKTHLFFDGKMYRFLSLNKILAKCHE